MSAEITSDEVKQLGRAAGFDLVGIAPAEPLGDFDRYQIWIESGAHGEMDDLARRVDERRDPRSLLPAARSVIVCALSYLTPHPFAIHEEPASRPIISRYAWGRDYHRAVKSRLKRLIGSLEAQLGRSIQSRLCVDTAPILERSFAARAGLGWIGKNSCLIHLRRGSFLFLGEALVDLALEPDQPMPDRCGRCERCLKACPTGALVEPGVLDARRCISCLTIETRGPIDPALAARFGTRVFGCDTCQEVCPHNQKAQCRFAASPRDFLPRPHLDRPSFDDLKFDSEEAFRKSFEGTPILRAGWEAWKRNMAIALRNARR